MVVVCEDAMAATGGGGCGGEILYEPFLDLVVSVICLLYMPRLHHHLGRRPIHILLEACGIECQLRRSGGQR